MVRFPSLISLAFIASFQLAPQILAQTASAPAAPNAVELYVQATQLIVAYSPSDLAEVFPDYPPYGARWDELARAAFEKNAPALELARRARSVDQAEWTKDNTALLAQMNKFRSLINEIADAASYQHFHGDDAGAFESLQDLLHMSAMLRLQATPRQYARPVVACGADAVLASRITMIAPDVRLTSDRANLHDLQTTTASQVITVLLDQSNPAADAGKSAAGWNRYPRAAETIARANAERTFAAMSLAAQLFRFDQNRWPISLDELVPAYLPNKSIDPWGDGTQTFGYVLLKAALANGKDRPLIYDRCGADDGLFYRFDAPQYWFYTDDGSDLPIARRKHGGQFRDLTHWRPGPKIRGAPTTRSLD